MAKKLFRIKSKRGLKPEVAGPLMQNTLRQELLALGRDVVQEYEKIVADWSTDSRPKFLIKVESGETRQSLKIVVEGTKDQKDRWRMLDTEGREGGTFIVANVQEFEDIDSPQAKSGTYQTRKYMRFQERYHPKTAAVARFGASDGGQRSGAWVRAKLVIQGAVEPRLFTATMLPSFRQAYQLAAKRGCQRAFRAMVKSGRVIPRKKFSFFQR